MKRIEVSSREIVYMPTDDEVEREIKAGNKIHGISGKKQKRAWWFVKQPFNKKGQRPKSLTSLYIERICCTNRIQQNGAKSKKKCSTKCEVT